MVIRNIFKSIFKIIFYLIFLKFSKIKKIFSEILLNIIDFFNGDQMRVIAEKQ